MSQSHKFLILGAGPSGLAFACRLLQHGETDFLVLEAAEEVGGLCRSVDVDGAPLDIGGGHFLDVANPTVLDFLFSFLPREAWDAYERDSRIRIDNRLIGSPIESHIWEMEASLQQACLQDIAEAGCNTGRPEPDRFVDWIYWKLGRRIAEIYMLPYNRKLFGPDLDRLGTYWLEKLPSVSYAETLKSCQEKRFHGRQPAHAHFLYPKADGYGAVWRRMGEALGPRIRLNTPARSLACGTRCVNGDFYGDVVVNTAPWTSFERIDGLSAANRAAIDGLRFASVDIDYVPERVDTTAHWIYEPDEHIAYHRILVRHNFCPRARGFWTETNAERARPVVSGAFRHRNRHAYPLNTIGKPEAMRGLLETLAEQSVFGLGRWGEWQHHNSDVVVGRACELADRLVADGRQGGGG